MIIEGIADTKAGMSPQGRAEFWQERMEANPNDPHYQKCHALAKFEAEVKSKGSKALCATGITYTPDSPNEHQVHELTGRKWIVKKPTQQTYPTGTISFLSAVNVMLFGGMGIDGLLAANDPTHGVWCLIVAFVFLMIVPAELPAVKRAYHNARIKRTNVDDVTVYRLKGRLTYGLELNLGAENWQRLINSLKANDAELSAIFTKFCEAKTLLIETADEAYRLYDAEPTLQNQYRIDGVDSLSRALNQQTGAKINELFINRDANAAQAKKDAEEKADHEAFVATVQQAMDSRLTIDAKLAFVEEYYQL